MTAVTPILLGIIIAATVAIVAYKAKKGNKVAEHVHKNIQLAPHALSVLILVAHASEITRVVSHVSMHEILIATVVFATWLITKQGSEEI